MSSVYNGHALVQGLSPISGATVAIGGFAKCFIDSVPIAHRSRFSEHVGTNGLTQAFIHTDQHFEIGVSFRPSSTTSAAAAEAELVFPAKGSVMTLSGFKPVKHGSNDILNGDWIIVSDSSITPNATEPATVDLTIRRYLDTTQMNTLKTNVPASVP